MAVTQHAVRALVAVPYSRLADIPQYASDFTVWSGSTPQDWQATGGAAVVRGYNVVTKHIDAVVTYASVGGGSFNYPALPVSVGTRYRVLATVRNVGTGPVAPALNPDHDTPRQQMMPGDTRVLSLDFTADAATAPLRIETVANPVSQAGVLAVDLVQVYQLIAGSVYDLHPTQASITLDESWSPYAKAALTCPLPPDDVLSRIDPRTGLRVAVTLTRSGAASLAVSDLTTMLAATGVPVYNLASNPRGPEWVTTDPWLRYPLTGLDVNTPNGVDGGSRFIASGDSLRPGFTLNTATPVGMGAGGRYTTSVYVRCNRDVEARLDVACGGLDTATTPFTPTLTLRAGRWTRVAVSFGPTTVDATEAILTVRLDTTSRANEDVLDITQVQIEASAAGVSEPTDYFDGGIGRVGEPAGFPTWTGLAFSTPSIKRFGATRVSDLSAMFGASVRRNELPNPSFQTGLAGWTATNATLTNPTTGGVQGVRYLVASVTAAGSLASANSPVLAAPAGTFYTVSAWVKGTVGRAVRIYTTQYSGAGGTGTATTTSAVAGVLSGAWQRVSWATKQGAGKVSFGVSFGATSFSAGDGLHLDGVLVELGTAAAGPYFDGSTPDTEWDYAWTGTPGASASTAVLTTVTAPVASLTDLFADQYNATLDTSLNQSRTFNLGLRSRRLDYVGSTMTLELAGDEMLLQDYGRLNMTEPALVPLATTDLRALIGWALNLFGTDLDPSSVTATIVAPAPADWSPGQSLWDFLDSYVTTFGLTLWCDENRRWYLTTPFTGSAGTDVISNLTGLDDTLDREGWGDAVILANHWTDPATGNDTTTYAGASASTTTGYTRTVTVEKIAKAAATVGAAGSLLTWIRAKGRQVTARAVSDYRVTPGRTAQIATTTTTTLDPVDKLAALQAKFTSLQGVNVNPVLTSSVTWDLPEDEMTVTTRDLP